MLQTQDPTMCCLGDLGQVVQLLMSIVGMIIAMKIIIDSCLLELFESVGILPVK